MITAQPAANLRGMATQLVADQIIQNKRWTKAGLSVLSEGYLSAQAKYERDIAALLAGAEALEAVQVAKAALEQIVNNRIGDVGRCGSRHCDCSECVATAALARLEGK